jgi:integrase
MVTFPARRSEQTKNMANKKVVLVRKCKTPDGWRRYPAVIGANGRLKPDAVLVGDVEVKYPVGHYELRSYVGSKLVYTRVKGDTPADALNALKNAVKRAHAVAAAGEANVPIVVDDNRVLLKDAQKKFIAAAEARGAMEAAEVYKRTLDDFFLRCTKLYADQLSHDDVVEFHRAMRKHGLSDRTVKNRHMNLRAFLLYLKFDKDEIKEIAGPTPRYEKTLPEIFDPAELKDFFAALDDEYDQLLFDVLLTCGLREQEVMHLERRDLSFARKTLKVQSKPHYGFKVKDSEQRELPVADDLMQRLLAYLEKKPGRLIFGAGGGEQDVPDGHLLRRLKTLVRNAGMNCGHCSGCENTKECERWFLHKFRATYITTLLRNGLDLRTVMKLSGHSDLESVMRYLRPAEGREVQDKVNAIRWR